MQRVASKEDRVVTEKKIRKDPPGTTRPEPAHAGLFQETPRVLQQAAQPPAPRPEAAPRRPTLTLEELARLAAAGDPILARELARRTAPRPEAPPPPPEASTPELIDRVRDRPDNPTRLAHALTVDLRDHGSYMGYLAVAQQAWRGEISPEVLADAYRQATDPQARNPGAIFMHAIRRGAGGW